MLWHGLWHVVAWFDMLAWTGMLAWIGIGCHVVACVSDIVTDIMLTWSNNYHDTMHKFMQKNMATCKHGNHGNHGIIKSNPHFFQTSPSYQSKSWFHLSLRNNLQCHSYMATKSMFQGGQSKTIIMSIKFRNELTPLDQMIPANSALWVQAVGHHCSALRVGKVCCLRAMWVAKAKEKALFHSLKVTDNPTQTKQTTIML